LRNASAREVENRLRALRAQSGGKQKSLADRVERAAGGCASVQGVWSPLMPQPELAASAPPPHRPRPFRVRGSAATDPPLRYEEGRFAEPWGRDHPVWQEMQVVPPVTDDDSVLPTGVSTSTATPSSTAPTPAAAAAAAADV
jgi:hypothetical protein